VAAQAHQLDDAGRRPRSLELSRPGGRDEDKSSKRRCEDPYAPHGVTVDGLSAGDYPLLRNQRAPSTAAATDAAIPNATSSAYSG
jgi:hypothetical protein